MFQLIKNYVSKMTEEDIKNFTLKKDIYLSNSEVAFIHKFIKKNYEALYANPNIDLSKYKSHFTNENYTKLIKVVNEYKSKYLGL